VRSARVDPVAIFGTRQIDQLVGDAEHLQELARGLALVRRGFVSENQDRVRHGDLGARRERHRSAACRSGRGRQQIAKLGPFAADRAIGLGLGRAIIVVHRGQVLEIEHVAERRLVDAEVEQPALSPRCRPRPSDRAQRIVIGIERI
jgi:hypothetical protein